MWKWLDFAFGALQVVLGGVFVAYGRVCGYVLVFFGLSELVGAFRRDDIGALLRTVEEEVAEAEGATLDDERLLTVAEAWNTLSEDARQSVLAVVTESAGQNRALVPGRSENGHGG